MAHWKAKSLYAAARLYWKLFKPLTWGVRLMLIKNDEVVLVRHTYRPGWYFPGGGVKRRETFQDAARREAHEEVGAELGALALWGIYTHLSKDKTDHEVVMICEEFEMTGQSDFEIAECRSFPLDRLPVSEQSGVAARIREYQAGNHRPDSYVW